MYYVRCTTRSSGASARGTPAQALRYVTDAHDAERDPSYSRGELKYVARLDPGWKADLEGGRVPLVGLGALQGCGDQARLAREFVEACQPYHDRRGSTGYLSYTFTMPKELSLLAEGHPAEARQAMNGALQVALDAAFPGKEYKAVAAIHARNEAGEVHYHAHVLVGKFARDPARGRVFSLNSASGGNTGKARLGALKQAWKQGLDAALKERLGLVVQQAAPFASPALTLADGSYVPPLNRGSRRLLDKHLSARISEPSASGALKTANFRWTHFDAAIYELASSKRAGGWSAEAFCELFPKLAARIKTYESRVETLKRIGYLTPEGYVTGAFALHYEARTGDHPELQRLRADLFKTSRGGRTGQRGGGGKGGGGLAATERPGPVAAPPAPVPAASSSRVEGDAEVDLWLALHRHRELGQRLERLGLSREDFRRIHERGRARLPTPDVLRRLRLEARTEPLVTEARHSQTTIRPLVRSYLAMQRGRVHRVFVLSKGVFTLQFGELKALADEMRARTSRDFFFAKERTLAQAGRRLQPLFWLGRVIMPDDFARLELAIKRCAQLPTGQYDHLYRKQLRNAYRNSREQLVAQVKSSAAPSPQRKRAPEPVSVPRSLESDAAQIHRANSRLAAAGLQPPFTTEVLRSLPPVTIRQTLGTLRQAGLLDDGTAWMMHTTMAQALGKRIQDAIALELRKSRDLDR